MKHLDCDLLLVRDQGVGGSNPLSPTNLSLIYSVTYKDSCALIFSSFFGTFGTTEGNSKPKPLFCPHPTKLNVLLDLVIKVAHVCPCVPHPVIVEALGTLSSVLQVRVPETPESGSHLVRRGEKFVLISRLVGTEPALSK